MRGFEPPTPWSQTRCATRLRYTPKIASFYRIKLKVPLNLLTNGTTQLLVFKKDNYKVVFVLCVMTIFLIIFGTIAGAVGGFFGVGGGMTLIPMLVLVGIDIKTAISISILQMVFTSIFGSFFNYKKNNTVLKDGFILGLGGFSGGVFSFVSLTYISDSVLKYLFLTVVSFAIYRISKTTYDKPTIKKTHNMFLLYVVGFFVGLFAMSIGVGGSVLLIPILTSYMYYNFKDASSLGLFFVIFSSTAGFLSLSFAGLMNYEYGLIVAISSVLGVYIGINLKNKTNTKNYKSLILALYIVVFVSMIFKL